MAVVRLLLDQAVLDLAALRLEARHLRAELLVLELEVAEARLERSDRRVARQDRTGRSAAGQEGRRRQDHDRLGGKAGQHGNTLRSRIRTNAIRGNPRSSWRHNRPAAGPR